MKNQLTHALVVALRWKKRWHDAHPDVGFGPPVDSYLNQVLEEAGIVLTELEKKGVIESYKLVYPREANL